MFVEGNWRISTWGGGAVGTAMVFRFGALPCTCNVQLRNVEIGESKGNQQEVGCGKRFQCVNQYNVAEEQHVHSVYCQLSPFCTNILFSEPSLCRYLWVWPMLRQGSYFAETAE